jgi:hypothetical protein
MSLTAALRAQLQNQEGVRFRDEDGEVHQATINWPKNRIEGLGGYYSKRRLNVNDAIQLYFEDGEVGLEALSAKPSKPRPSVQPIEPDPAPAIEAPPQKRVKVGPYPREVLYPHVTPVTAEPPGFAADLEGLGFQRESGGPPWIFKAALGRRAFTLGLARLGELEPKEMLALRRSGAVQYAGIVAGESARGEALKEIAALRGLGDQTLIYLSPEALQKLTRLRGVFPMGPLDVERFLREGNLELSALAGLEGEIAAMLGERANFSAVLVALSEFAPQRIFLLADLMPSTRELGLEPDAVQQILDVLSGPPFLLLKRLSPGEFLMRTRVEEALKDWSEYAALVNNRLGLVLDL